ncbi:MAG: uroporphyrinogen decarboxylase [Alphaproteobacteria bacterium]|nr:uroporphyrinogen decarboxylase [Alphaproteobacteria bacterium]
MIEPQVDKPILNALRGQITERKPIWLMRQAGRYLPEYREIRTKATDFLNLCLTPALASEITLQPIRRFGFDAAIVFADILVIPHALGQKVWFAEGEGPRLEPLTPDRIVGLKPDLMRSKLAPIFETLDRVKGALPAATTLIGFAGAPWTVATYMIAGRGSDDSAAAKLFAFRNQEAFAQLLEILIETTADYLIAQIQAGAEVVQIFESWAGTIPVGQLEDFSLQPIREIVRRVRKQTPSVPVIVFPRGAGVNYVRYARETGATALSIDQQTPMAFASEAFPSNVVLQGNLDPLALIAGGRALTQAVTDIKKQTQGRAHIFNLGHGIRPETPIEHVEKLLDLIRSTAS